MQSTDVSIFTGMVIKAPGISAIIIIMTTSRNGSLRALTGSLLSRYSSASDGAGGLDDFANLSGVSGLFYYLLYLGRQPIGLHELGGANRNPFGQGISSWWWTRYWPDYNYNPLIGHGVDLLTHLTLGAGITLASDDPAIMDLWKRMPRLSRPSAQIAYERIRIVEGETWLGIYPLPERKTWGFKRYARHNITDVKMLDGIAAAYLLQNPEDSTPSLVPDIDYATEHGIPECIIRIADSEDPSVRAHPPVADAIEPARRLYDYYLGWSDGERELQKLLYTWEHDPQVKGVSEPDFDDDTGQLMGMPVANREGGTPTGAKIFQTAGRRSPLSTTRELKQMVATALHLSEYHFGETRNSNRSNSETLSDDLKDYLQYNQNLHRDAYAAILEHILPGRDDYELQLKPLDKIDTAQRIEVFKVMIESDMITVPSAARLALPLVGMEPEAIEEEIKLLEERDDFAAVDLLRNGGADQPGAAEDDGLNGL